MKERILLLIIGVVCCPGSIACNQLAVSDPKPLAAVDLAKDYKKSKAEVNSKFGGKDVTVRGYTYVEGKLSPTIDGGTAKTGLILLTEKDDQDHNEVYCEFGAADLAEFQKVKGKQYVTVKGTFEGQDKPRLRDCKLVKVE